MTQRQIFPLNAIRGIAAMLVVFSHLTGFGPARFGPSQQGYFGVMLFFTLSGFLMGYMYLHKDADRVALQKYAVARFARIAPPYLIVVLASIVIYNFFDPQFPYAIGRNNALRHLLFSGNVSVLWSIAPEVQFYILFIGLWFSVHLAVRKRNAELLLIAVVVVIALIALRGKVPGTFVGSKIEYFLMGSFLGWLHHHVPGSMLSVRSLLAIQSLLLAVFAMFMCGLVSFGIDPWLDLAPSLIVGLTIFVFSQDKTIIDRLLHARPFQLLADWSFSIYLTHMPVFYLLLKYSGLTGPVAVVVAITTALLFAAGFSILIEHPICGFTRKQLMRLTRPPKLQSVIVPADGKI